MCIKQETNIQDRGSVMKLKLHILFSKIFTFIKSVKEFLLGSSLCVNWLWLRLENGSYTERWIRRYRTLFVVGSVILSIQAFLAYIFFPIDAEGDELAQEHRDLSEKGLNIEVSI